MQGNHRNNKNTTSFLEQTLLTIFLWIGMWGIVTMFFDHYIKSFGYKLATYIIFVIVSFSLLHVRNHIDV